VARDAVELLLLSVASREGVFSLHIRVLGVIVQWSLIRCLCWGAVDAAR
jgi:hypothetical protein